MTAPPRSTAEWDISFLRVGTLVTAACAAVAAVVTGALAGWAHGLSVLVGAAVVTVFFVVSGVVIAWAGRIADAFTLPTALGMFFVKALVLFGVLNALPAEGWLDRRTMAWTVIAGALLWSGVQLRWVWTRQLYYVPPPPAPGPAAPVPDPERPASRG